MRDGSRLGVLVLALGMSVAACSSNDDAAADGGPDEATGETGDDGATDPGDDGATDPGDDGAGETVPPPPPACAAAAGGGSATVAAPELLATLFDRWHEAWLASPAVADLDGDTTPEIVVARDELLLVWHLDNTVVWRGEAEGRIWSSPVVADLRPDLPGLEVAAASRARIHAWDAAGSPLPGFPFEWRDELRSLAAGDLDGDGDLELAAVTTSPLSAGGQRDILIAIHADGTVVAGFPPNTTGAAGCDDR
ncbi:MAG: hypothetical protein JXB32_26205, partial [Deltaproteobacteria bacterium]|nr:hypothetical protein [Deltaproteobacteria bacterium]